MVISQYGRTVALGPAGRLVRLPFATSAAAGIYGVYLTWFASYCRAARERPEQDVVIETVTIVRGDGH